METTQIFTIHSISVFVANLHKMALRLLFPTTIFFAYKIQASVLASFGDLTILPLRSGEFNW